MSVINQNMANRGAYGTTVRDMLIAKAIQNGYNPFCKSTDARARRVTEEMRSKAQGVYVPENAVVAVTENKAVVREVKAADLSKKARPHREVIAIENFELVKRRGMSLSLGMLVSVIVSVIILAMVVYSGSVINEDARYYSKLGTSIAALKEEDKNLTYALEEKNDLEVIEAIAVNELGMVKIPLENQRYVSIKEENSITVYQPEKEETSVSMRLLNTFGDKINGFLEYLD